MEYNLFKKKFDKISSQILDNVISVYVYGSIARGENDNNSDCDILICLKDCDDCEYNIIKSCFQKIFTDDQYELSFYRMSELREMQKKGSYFLWHIKTEAVLIYKNCEEVQKMLDNLPKYANTLEDLLEYKNILEDVNDSINQDDVTIFYELSVLATIARNTCIACCYLIGIMDFGRISPVIKTKEYFKSEFPFSIDEYLDLYKYRLYIVRNISINKHQDLIQYGKLWVDKIGVLLENALRLEENANVEKE